MKINLNDYIKVKLTDLGKDIYYHRYDEFNKLYGIYGREVLKPSFPKEDENGYASFPLWEFISIYGQYIGMGKPNVIEPIEIIDEDAGFANGFVTIRDVELAMLEKGQESKRYKLGETWELNLMEIREALNAISPTKLKNGKWIHDGHHIICDQCGTTMCDKDREGDAIPQNYCPNCGAKMEGEKS